MRDKEIPHPGAKFCVQDLDTVRKRPRNARLVFECFPVESLEHIARGPGCAVLENVLAPVELFRLDPWHVVVCQKQDDLEAGEGENRVTRDVGPRGRRHDRYTTRQSLFEEWPFPGCAMPRRFPRSIPRLLLPRLGAFPRQGSISPVGRSLSHPKLYLGCRISFHNDHGTTWICRPPAHEACCPTTGDEIER